MTTLLTPAPPNPPRKRPFTRTTKVALCLILVAALAETLALGTRYYFTDRVWVIVDNAQVDGDQREINAPASGSVTNWRLDLGSPVQANQIVGFVEIEGTGGRNKMPIRSSGQGTVARTSVTEGTHIQAGSLLAVVYGDGGVYVTARVPEHEIHDVRLGAPVDITVAAAPDAPITGTVAQISPSSAGVSELHNDPDADPTDLKQPVYPGPDTDPQNPQRVEQYIPVTILFTNTSTAWVAPGMNVTVHIHKDHA